jgi:hypothetical protein
VDGQVEEGSLGVLVDDTVWQFETPANSGIKVSCFLSIFLENLLFSSNSQKYEGMLINLFDLIHLYVLYVQIVNQKGGQSTNLFKTKDFNFQKLGIGGLDAEFGDIFRRAFASRVFPPHVIAK